jgi:TrmH family RNA methyltransferase
MITDRSQHIITSPANRRVVDARKLRQRKYRQASGRFLLEGLQALHLALDAGIKVYEVFHLPESFQTPASSALLERFRRSGVELIAITPRVMEALSERDEPQGIIATCQVAGPTLAALEMPAGPRLVLVLDRLQDPGNLGTLIRTADAAGASAVVLIEPCVDLHDPKALRSSMGSRFNLPVISTQDVPGLFDWLNRHGLQPTGADPHRGQLWGETIWPGRIALILGNEARGLSPDVAAHVSTYARLPIAGKADSLNVAVAGGILMYAWLKANPAAQASNSKCTGAS